MLAAPPEVLATFACCFDTAGRDCHPPGTAAIATWPAAVQALAHRLYAAGVPALHLPIFGEWLFRDVTSSLHLAGALTTHGFQELATRTFRTGRHELRDAQLVVWRCSGILPRWRAVPTWHTGA